MEGDKNGSSGQCVLIFLFTVSTVSNISDAYELFIESEIFGRSTCVVAFNPNCSGKIKENLNRGGYCCIYNFSAVVVHQN
jgi:hypothetical protein